NALPKSSRLWKSKVQWVQCPTFLQVIMKRVRQAILRERLGVRQSSAALGRSSPVESARGLAQSKTCALISLCGSRCTGARGHGLMEQVSEVRQQRVFLLPGRVHETAHFAQRGGDIQPSLHVL